MWHGKKDSILNCNNSVSLLLHFELQILQESYIFMWDLWFTESWFSEEKRRKEYLFLYGVNSKRAPLQRRANAPKRQLKKLFTLADSYYQHSWWTKWTYKNPWVMQHNSLFRNLPSYLRKCFLKVRLYVLENKLTCSLLKLEYLKFWVSH